MVTIPGTLIVKTTPLDGKNVKSGSLVCSIGRFIVKNSHIDLLKEGQHEGFFEITEITQGCYQHEGRCYFELEASLKKMAFNFTQNMSKPVSLQQEIALEPSSTHSNHDKSLEKPIDMLQDIDNDATLFGEHWPLGDEVKLDMTQSRDQIRLQNERLRRLGYQFDSKQQTWIKTA